MRVSFKNILPLSLAICCIGCQTTTGDPRAGGFWGWEQEKAIQRQSDLRAQADGASQAAASEQTDNAQLIARKRAEAVETRILEVRWAALLDENDRLEQELLDLRNRGSKESAELKVLLHELDAKKNESAAQSKLISKTNNPTKASGTLSERRVIAGQLDSRNVQLQRAILIYLQR
jgi:hypothetical protein